MAIRFPDADGDVGSLGEPIYGWVCASGRAASHKFHTQPNAVVHSHRSACTYSHVDTYAHPDAVCGTESDAYS